MKKPESLLSLDLGSYNVKLIEAERQELQVVIKNFSVTPLPHELMKEDAMSEPSYADFLRKLLSQTGISSSRAVVCISHPQLEVKNLILPAMKKKELKASISWEVKDMFTIRMDEAIIDYTVLREMETNEGKKMELCVAAVPKKVIENHISLLKALRLSPVAFLVEPQTAWGVFKNIPELSGKETIALINMGAEKSVISIFENGRLELMRNLSIASNKFNQNVLLKVRTIDDESLDIARAESIKTRYGIALLEGKIEENINPQDIFAALRPLLEDFVFEVGHLFEYYKTEHGKTVEMIAFYGGGSKMPGFSDYVSKNLGIPVLSLDLSKIGSIKCPDIKREGLKEKDAFLVNAIGALFVREGFLNLIPQEDREQLEMKLQTWRWIKIWASFLAGLILIYMPIKFIHWLKQNSLTKLENKYKSLLAIEEDLSRYNSVVSELDSKMSLCNKLAQGEPFWDDLLKELAGLVPDSIILKEISYNVSDKISSGESKLPFVINGIVHRKDVRPEGEITKFLQNLGKSQYFDKIKLEFSRETKVEEEKVLEFEIGCEIKP